MTQINLKINRKMFNDSFFPLLYDYSSRWEVYRGGAGSGKSHHIMQKLILKCLRDKRKICICRRYGSTLDKSCWELFISKLKDWHIYEYMKVNLTNKKITFPNGSIVYFVGLDDEQKILSIAGITDFFIEECFEVPRDIVEQVNLRLRSKKKDCQIIMAFNPISADSWCYDFCEVNPPKSFKYHLSTYKDNKFLPKEYAKELEELITRNPTKAEVFVFNRWGSDPTGRVFKNIEFKTNFDYQSLLKDRNWEVRVGIDVGWNDPTAISVSLLNQKTGELYLIHEWYQRGATLDDMLNAIYNLHIEKQKIYVDSASPQVISYLKSNGIMARPCIKGKGSVEARITYLQNLKIYVLEDNCPSGALEARNFVYLKDRTTGKYTDKTDHTYSHLICDALGYSVCDLYTNKNLKAMSTVGLCI